MEAAKNVQAKVTIAVRPSRSMKEFCGNGSANKNGPGHLATPKDVRYEMGYVMATPPAYRIGSSHDTYLEGI